MLMKMWLYSFHGWRGNSLICKIFPAGKQWEITALVCWFPVCVQVTASGLRLSRFPVPGRAFELPASLSFQAIGYGVFCLTLRLKFH
jgi:hypothetical protein